MTLVWTGISTYEVNLEKQEVIVKGSVDYDTVLEKIKKTGKEVSLLIFVTIELSASYKSHRYAPERRCRKYRRLAQLVIRITAGTVVERL